jgi:Ca-activated chloride channel family protein
VASTVADRAVTALWARAYLRDLEDAYSSRDRWAGRSEEQMERDIVATSLRFGVLCRFTAWLAVDTRVVADGGEVHRVIQPVEPPAGWDMLEAAPPMMLAAAAPGTFAPAAMASLPRPMDRAALARRGGRRLSRSRRAPEVAEEVARPDELIAARSQSTEEARRLRGLDAAPLADRREALADLGSRLTALVRHLASAGVDEALLAPLRDLLGELEADRPMSVLADAFEELWGRTLRVLDDLAAATAAKPGARKEFWKRHS